ncbi:MAG TPA: hypothetical protein VNW97_16885 [Candidatus Saccharimonadales bacterium]|jgi:hypothetical protein|nr:hypothetical protein [Candidatus Saccharimonadales bacterium]
MQILRCSSAVLLLIASSLAAPKTHTIVLGKAVAIKLPGAQGSETEARIRPLLIDDRLKEYTTGAAHDVTDRVFVIRRVFRLNDTLPSETGKPARFIWRLGGWLSVDRQTRRITQLNLPFFDPQISETSWFRDYAAYCGNSDDGGKAYAMVFQLGRRKPLLKQEFPGSSCPAPGWEREPLRVTFDPPGVEKAGFVVRSRNAEYDINSQEPDESKEPDKEDKP